MKCGMIQDLLPLYYENLTSQESNQEIETHLNTCKTCAEFYETIKSNPTTQEIPNHDIQPLKKIKKSVMIKAIVSFFVGAVLLASIFLFLFWGVIPAKQEDIQVSYTAEMLENGDYEIDFSFSATGNWILNSRVNYAENSFYQTELKLYCVKKIPFDDRGTGDFSLGFVNTKPFTEEDILVINYRDKEIYYYLKEIAEQAGLQ